MHNEEKSNNALQDVPFSKDRVPIAEETMLRFSQYLQNSMQSIYSIGQRRDYVVAEMTRRWREICVNIDWESVEKEFLPPNLKSVDNITAVVDLASKEGLPLVGIPRSEIVKELVTAPTLKERISILREHLIDITDDCKSALSGIDHEAVKQCKSAIDALRGGFAAPAQSHAANVIESTLFHLFGSKRQEIVKNQSKKPYSEWSRSGKGICLLFLALANAIEYWDRDKYDAPSQFNRHASVHGADIPGVFSDYNALIAVMSATSLLISFEDLRGIQFKI